MHYFPHCDENLSGCKSQTPLVARRFRHVRENGRWHSPLQGISSWYQEISESSKLICWTGLDLLNHKDLLLNLFFSLQIINMAAPDTIDERVTDKLKLLLKTNSSLRCSITICWFQLHRSLHRGDHSTISQIHRWSTRERKSPSSSSMKISPLLVTLQGIDYNVDNMMTKWWCWW